MTSKNNSDEWTSTANRRSSSSGTSAMHPNSTNEQIQIIEATTINNGKEKKRLLLYRHPSWNENNLQPYFAHSSSLVFMTDDGNNISNFWIISLQMSCVNSYSLFRSSKQVRTDFVTADGCESLCASEVLLHPSICFTYSNKHRNNNNNTTTTKSNNYKVIALSQHDISTNNNNDKVVIRTIAQLIANWWVMSNTLPAKPKSTNKATSIKPLVSVSHSNISTTTTTYGKSFLSTVSWAATKLLSKFDLMDDPQEAQELQSCVELLQKDRDQISKRNNTMDSNVLVVPASSYSTTTSTANEDGTTLLLLLSVDLIGHCCQYLLDRLPNAEAILGQNNDFYSYYYKNTIRPQIILHMHPSSSSSELISFWKFCQLAGTTTTTHSQQQQQPNHNTEDDHYFELSTAVPQLLSHISKDDSYLLFHVLNSSGKIHKDNNNDDDTVVVFVPEDGSFREVDVAIFRLLHAQWKVEQRVATYTQQYTELGIRAVSIKKQQQQQTAIHLMKQRKIVESEIDKSQQIIFNLEQTKLHLEQAYTNKELTNIFELCRDAMKNTNTTADLSIVEDVMLVLEEEMEQVQELTVATSSAPSNNYYELEDLERELAGLAIAAPPLKQVKSATSTASREETNVVDKVDTASRISKESTPTLVDCTSDAAVSSNEIEESVEPSNTKDVPSSLELLLA